MTALYTLSKLVAFAGDQKNMTKKLKCFQDFFFFKGHLLLTTQSRLLTNPRKKRFENIVGKGETAGYQHFLLFP